MLWDPRSPCLPSLSSPVARQEQLVLAPGASSRSVRGRWLQHLSVPQCTGEPFIGSNLGWSPSHWRISVPYPHSLCPESQAVRSLKRKALPRPSGCTSPPCGNESFPQPICHPTQSGHPAAACLLPRSPHSWPLDTISALLLVTRESAFW